MWDPDKLVDLSQALIAASGVALPLVLAWLQKANTLRQSNHFMELLESRDRLTALLEKEEDDIAKGQLSRHKKRVLEEITECSKAEPKRTLFYFFVVLEMFLMSFVVFTIDLANKAPFLEGVLRHSRYHFLILLLCTTGSAFLSLRIVTRLEIRRGSRIGNLLSTAIFNAILVCALGCAALVLLASDPFTQGF